MKMENSGLESAFPHWRLQPSYTTTRTEEKQENKPRTRNCYTYQMLYHSWHAAPFHYPTAYSHDLTAITSSNIDRENIRNLADK